jgi:hypothetical protein
MKQIILIIVLLFISCEAPQQINQNNELCNTIYCTKVYRLSSDLGPLRLREFIVQGHSIIYFQKQFYHAPWCECKKESVDSNTNSSIFEMPSYSF